MEKMRIEEKKALFLGGKEIQGVWDEIWLYDEIAICIQNGLLVCFDANTGSKIYAITGVVNVRYLEKYQLIEVTTKNSKGLYSLTGEEIIPTFNFSDLRIMGKYVVLCRGGCEGIATLEGKCLLSPEYDSIYSLKNIIIAQKDNKCKIYSHNYVDDSMKALDSDVLPENITFVKETSVVPDIHNSQKYTTSYTDALAVKCGNREKVFYAF